MNLRLVLEIKLALPNGEKISIEKDIPFRGREMEEVLLEAGKETRACITRFRGSKLSGWKSFTTTAESWKKSY